MFDDLFVSVIFFIICFSFGMFQSIPNKVKVVGEIISLEDKRNADEDKNTYTAVIEIYADNEMHTIKSPYKLSSFRIGKSITMYYNKNNPNEYYVPPLLWVYIFAFWMGVLALILFINSISNINILEKGIYR